MVAPIADAPAFAQASDVSVSLSSLENGTPSTSPLFGSGRTVEYQITVDNSGSADSGTLTIYAKVPRDATYVAGSGTCGSVPDCTESESSTNPDVVPFTVTFDLSSVAAGTSAILSYEVATREGALFQTLGELAHWSGDGCAKSSCTTNRVLIPVLPVPVQLSSSPGNGASVPTGKTVTYTLTVHNDLDVAQDNVVVTDPVPNGTSYVSGSATCLQTAGCTASQSDGVVTYTIASVPPDAGNSVKVRYSATVTSNSAPVTNTGAWTGDLCDSATACATNSVRQAVSNVTTAVTTATTTAPATAPADATTTTTRAPAAPVATKSSDLAFTGTGAAMRLLSLAGIVMALFGLALLSVLALRSRRVSTQD